MNCCSNLFPSHLWTWMSPKYTCMKFNLKFVFIIWKSKRPYSSIKSPSLRTYLLHSFAQGHSFFSLVSFFSDQPPPVKLLIEESCFLGTPVKLLVFWRPACTNFYVLVLPNKCLNVLVPHTDLFHCIFTTSHLFLNGGFKPIISHHMNQQQLKDLILQEKLSFPGKKPWRFGDCSKLKHNRCKWRGRKKYFFEPYLDFFPSVPPFFFFLCPPFLNAREQSKWQEFDFHCYFCLSLILYSLNLFLHFLNKWSVGISLTSLGSVLFSCLSPVCIPYRSLRGYLFTLLWSSSSHDFSSLRYFHSRNSGSPALNKIETFYSEVFCFFLEVKNFSYRM